MWRILLESIKKGVVTSAPPEGPAEYEQRVVGFFDRTL